MVSVVEHLSDLGFFRARKVTGDWYTVYCPFHKNGNERKPSCGISLKTSVRNGVVRQAGHLNCFTCHASMSLKEAVERLKDGLDLSESDVEWIHRNVPGYDDGDNEYDSLVPQCVISSLASKFAVNYVRSMVHGSNQKYVPEEELETYRYTVPYMYDRGLTDEVIERYDIGFDGDYVPEGRKKPVPCITFPVRNRSGNCLFVFRRSVQGRYFNYPTGVQKPLYGLYELDKRCRTVYVCESAFNLMTLAVHGLQGVALFGTGNSLQIEQLKSLGAHSFILAMDPDEAGNKARQKLRKLLSSTAFVFDLKGFPNSKDLNDLTEDEFNSLYVE